MESEIRDKMQIHIWNDTIDTVQGILEAHNLIRTMAIKILTVQADLS